MDEGEDSSYRQHLASKFANICSQLGDPNPTKPLMTDISNRQQILFMQFDMEKKGKNLGLSETRLLNIQNNALFQVNSKGEEKQLPFPNSIVMVRRTNQSWPEEYAQHKAFIVLQFSDRTDITVYFKEIIEWRQIGMFLRAQIQKNKGVRFDGLAQRFRVGVAEELAKRIGRMKAESADIRELRVKRKIYDIFKFKLSDRTAIKQMLTQWKSKALFKPRQVSIKLTPLALRAAGSLDGVLKLWVRRTVDKQWPVIADNFLRQEGGLFEHTFGQSQVQMYLMLSTEDEFQFEIDSNNSTIKSDRFLGADVCKIAHGHRFIELNLIGKGLTAYLSVQIDVKGVAPTTPKLEITPQHYRIIDQLYVPPRAQFTLPQIHTFYLHHLTEHRSSTPYYIGFSRVKQLFQLLKIDQLVGKFYLVSPFKDYLDVRYKASAVFQYFSADYDRDLFYDVEKLMWKSQKFQHRQVLSALKSFDENPKFNFTEPFLWIVERMQELAQNQSVGRWRDDLFSPDVEGLKATVFFLALAVVKSFTGLYIHQEYANRRTLPHTSLLFVYVLQREMPEIWLKLLKLQLNIQAFFGKHMVSLFAELFQGDLFARVLLLLIEERNKDPQQQLFICTLPALFLALMELVDGHPCAYLSAEHYMLTFTQICRGIPNLQQYFLRTQQYSQLLSLTYTTHPFTTLSSDLQQFYLHNAYSGDFGEISRQLYQQFVSYHYKNQMDLRKIYIVVDKIELCESARQLNLTIFQSAVKIYEHNFKGVDLNKLDHFIEVKLTRLDELTLICNNGKYSFSCRLDPRQIPSNLYFHLVKPLTLTYHMSPEANRHIFLQLYIKDNCQLQSLQNPVPTLYRQLILQDKIDKDDIVFGKRFDRSFRMAENNFNLLYSKLGWYGCHYLVPDDRLVGVQVLAKEEGRTDNNNIHERLARLAFYGRAVLGKAVLPQPANQLRTLTVDLIKQSILTHCHSQPVSTHFSDLQLYSSASRLLCYTLDNFSLPSSLQFVQFYWSILLKLPLISYLTHQPKQFYYLPSFSFQVGCSTSTAVVVICEKGPAFQVEFGEREAEGIEERASWVHKIPQEMEFSYTDGDMSMDQFMRLLRLNILKRVAYGEGERRARQKRWPNSLVSPSVTFPNYRLHNFYQTMNETKQIVHFQFKELSSPALPFVYSDYALIRHRWRRVHSLAELVTAGEVYFYVVEREERRKYIVEGRWFIRVGEDRPRRIELREGIADSMEVVSYELGKMFSGGGGG